MWHHLQIPGGVKRSLPTSPGSSHAGAGPPPPKQHRAPLLPTPEPGTFMRPQSKSGRDADVDVYVFYSMTGL